MKIIRWISDNILFLYTLFLLVFIPLYPKIPLIDVEHTWVYIRLEDFLVAVALFLFGIQWLRKKAYIKTPLTMPIAVFWIVGAISTIFAIFVIFPTLSGVFPNLAILNYLRRIEYLSLFFVAFSSIRDKKQIHYYIAIITATLLAVVVYGFGQKFLGWPAFLTMNEEFAKGIPLRLSALARIPSTFAGHYDLAGYLVMIIPLLGSMIFAYKRWYIKISLLLSAVLGLLLLMMTASRVSFAVYLCAIAFMLLLQKKKWFILPVVIASIILLQSFQGISDRFNATVSQVDVVVDARTGQAIGIAKTVEENGKKKVVIEESQSTGEELPQGTGYINVPAEGKKEVTEITFKRSTVGGTTSGELNIEGNFIIKKAFAYDLSFTTRFQGTWPRAYEAFQRNVFLGSGYSSINLASDNNYLRILGETGILGLASFLFIFLVGGIYLYRMLPQVDSPVVKSFAIGAAAAVFGLALNAVLIDVFEASKDAFYLWMLIGVAVGALHLYEKKKINMKKELKQVLTSIPAIIVYLLLLSLAIYTPMLTNYFVADDFVWLRSIADCSKGLNMPGGVCDSMGTRIFHFFTQSGDFFYRPGTKLYFLGMYAIFGLNNVFYHLSSVFMLFVTAAALFVITTKLLKSRLFGFITALLFLGVSSHYEAVFWVSAVGHLAASMFALVGLLFFVLWKEYKKWYLLPVSLVSAFIAPLFHEFGVIAPLLVLSYAIFVYSDKKHIFTTWSNYLYLSLIPLYLGLKYISGSWWSQGDYAYNLLKFPLNALGNSIGYLMLILFGTQSLSSYQAIRSFGRDNMLLVAVVGLVILLVGAFVGYRLFTRLSKEGKRVVKASLLLFVVPLLPFLGLGTITSRYTLLASAGVILFLVFLLQLIYKKIARVNYYAALAIILIVAALTLAFHLSELRRINQDWAKAGTITKEMLARISNKYAGSQESKVLPPNPVFYFVHVPATVGEAWVFPVGLKDALWFTFRNENLTVKTVGSLDEALKEAEASRSARVFQFEKDGVLEELVKTRKKIESQ